MNPPGSRSISRIFRFQLVVSVCLALSGLSVPRHAASQAAVDREAVDGLIRKGAWSDAQKIVEALLAENPDDAEARRWQGEISPIDTWQVVLVRGKKGVVGQLSLRKRWLTFTPDPGTGQKEDVVRIPIDVLEAKYKEHTSWVQPGYGTVSHGIDIKVGNLSYRILTRFPFFEVISMQRRIRSTQVGSLRPEPPPPPSAESILRGKDAQQVKGVVQESIAAGRWKLAEAALRELTRISPDDPDAKRLLDETAVIRKWQVRTWSPSDGYAGTLYVRKHWVTFEGEDYGGNSDKPQKNDSFHYPLTALKEISTCSEKEYGAKAGTGGLLDLVPGMASTVATGKNWGFELSFAGGAKNYKLIVRGDGIDKESAKAEIQFIKSLLGSRE